METIVNQPTQAQLSEWVSNNRYTRKSKQGMLPLWIYIDVNDEEKRWYIKIIPRLKNRQYAIGNAISVSSEMFPKNCTVSFPAEQRNQSIC